MITQHNHVFLTLALGCMTNYIPRLSEATDLPLACDHKVADHNIPHRQSIKQYHSIIALPQLQLVSSFHLLPWRV